MKIAVIGSRSLTISNLNKYLPQGTTEIVSGGAKGINGCAGKYAFENGLKITEFLLDYSKYDKAAPIIRNDLIIDYSDEVFAFGDGHSKGTKYVIEQGRKKSKKNQSFCAETVKNMLLQGQSLRSGGLSWSPTPTNKIGYRRSLSFTLHSAL